MIKLIFVLLTTVVSDKPDRLEQKASDYFFDNIFGQNYNDVKVIEFQNQTDTSKYWGTVHQCKNWDQKTSGLIMSSIPGKSVNVKAKREDIKIKSISKNSG